MLNDVGVGVLTKRYWEMVPLNAYYWRPCRYRALVVLPAYSAILSMGRIP
jgi:hypothetical protein